jgi:tRNA nucleotidyltransferase (CCA-adding enzyme)
MLHSHSYTPVIIPATDKIVLNETEQKIFQLLKDCVHQRGLKVEMRVAGGWVRDKLLRIDCKDVDIALDTMMGETFAKNLCEFMAQHNLHPKGVGVIQSNPDRSKHLETATINIFGQPIDFVNLRAEEYANDSRIPDKIEFGTPLQDALRRDITINSLFYHIQDETIEDWSGRGLMDLEEGIIRTPLASETTLMDDPLRLLRIIRFSSRYGYALVPEIINASMIAAVQEAFLAKVSRERVGTEFDKTISDRNGFSGLRLYSRLNAFHLLTMEQEDVDYGHLLELFDAIVRTNFSADERRLAFLCFPLLPFNTSIERIQSIVRLALKLPNKDIQESSRVLKNSGLISQYAAAHESDPVVLGRLLKDIGMNWQLAFWLASVQHVFRSDVAVNDSLAVHRALVETIERLGLASAWSITPLLTGNEVREILQLKEGREIGVNLAKLMDWQYVHPNATVEEAKDFLKSLQCVPA